MATSDRTTDRSIHALRRAVSSTLVTAARHWRKTIQSALTSFGVSEACATPLLIAGRLGGGVRQVALAEHVGIEGPSLVRLLDQLCAGGFVTREEDPVDRRAKTIWLTDMGRAAVEKIEAELVALRIDVLKDISRADLEAALRVLQAFELAARGATENTAAGS